MADFTKTARFPDGDALAKEFESSLWKHVLDPWFPRCLDETSGGFLCDFDRAWKPNGTHEKQIDFQSRQTVLAAEASLAYPDAHHLKKATEQGFECLHSTMWDHEFGGWFDRTDRAGKPMLHETKHTHGFTYSITACATAFEATGDANALKLAKDGFQWLESFAHDKKHGGYYGYMRRDGRLILNEEDNPVGGPLDSIGTPIGFKDANVHTDMLQALSNLYRVWPDPLVRRRLEETVTLLTDRLLSAYGAVSFLYEPDWTPVPHLERFGITIQGAHRLLEANTLLDNKQASLTAARRIVDTAMRKGWDTHRGGMFFGGPAVLPFDIQGRWTIVTDKLWWVQCESLRGLLALDLEDDGKGIYHEYFLDQWAYIKRWLIDEHRTGFFREGLDASSRRERWRIGLSSNHPAQIKGTPWKDGSHEGRALLYCIQELKKKGTSVN